jgi:hypothetical protein
MSRRASLKCILAAHVSIAAIASPLAPEEHRRVIMKAAKYLNVLTRISEPRDDEPRR